MQTTFIFLKPDAVQRGLMGKILQRFEDKGLSFVGMKLVQVSESLAKQHYAEHAQKPFFPGLLAFITSSPVLACAVQGPNSVAVCRSLIGATNGQKANPGTIRGDLGMSGANNLIHGSDSPESAERELALWFTPSELLAMQKTANQWIYDPSDLGK